MVAGVVQGGPDGSDLAIHHPGRGRHVDPGVGLGHRGPRVELERGVVVHRTMAVQDPAGTVVGVLVDAQIS